MTQTLSLLELDACRTAARRSPAAPRTCATSGARARGWCGPCARWPRAGRRRRARPCAAAPAQQAETLSPTFPNHVISGHIPAAQRTFLPSLLSDASSPLLPPPPSPPAAAPAPAAAASSALLAPPATPMLAPQSSAPPPAGSGSEANAPSAARLRAAPLGGRPPLARLLRGLVARARMACHTSTQIICLM